MRIFFRGSSRCAGFILPATIAAVLICTCLYCAFFSLVSARHELLKKQIAEWNTGLEQYNTEISGEFGASYAAD
jgi:hypothetical protein